MGRAGLGLLWASFVRGKSFFGHTSWAAPGWPPLIVPILRQFGSRFDHFLVNYAFKCIWYKSKHIESNLQKNCFWNSSNFGVQKLSINFRICVFFVTFFSKKRFFGIRFQFPPLGRMPLDILWIWVLILHMEISANQIHIFELCTMLQGWNCVVFLFTAHN